VIEYSAMLPAGEVERRTSLSGDLLILWERQFGFPSSQLDAVGNVFYFEDDLPRLRLIGFLVHSGERAARLMDMTDSALADKAGDLRAAIEVEACSVDANAVRDCMRMIGSNDCGDLEARMRSHIISHGLSAFVQRVAAPLCQEVGIAWETGRFSVFQEHIFAELLERTLTVASASLFQPDALRFGRPKPAVLLAARRLPLRPRRHACAGLRHRRGGPRAPLRHRRAVVLLVVSAGPHNRDDLHRPCRAGC